MLLRAQLANRERLTGLGSEASLVSMANPMRMVSVFGAMETIPDNY
jgi:hypothetical protein